MKGLVLFGICLVLASHFEKQIGVNLASLIMVFGFICLCTNGFSKN